MIFPAYKHRNIQPKICSFLCISIHKCTTPNGCSHCGVTIAIEYSFGGNWVRCWFLSNVLSATNVGVNSPMLSFTTPILYNYGKARQQQHHQMISGWIIQFTICYNVCGYCFSFRGFVPFLFILITCFVQLADWDRLFRMEKWQKKNVHWISTLLNAITIIINEMAYMSIRTYKTKCQKLGADWIAMIYTVSFSSFFFLQSVRRITWFDNSS